MNILLRDFWRMIVQKMSQTHRRVISLETNNFAGNQVETNQEDQDSQIVVMDISDTFQ